MGVDAKLASIYFSICSLTAPVSGVVVGGIFTSKLGGYNEIKTMKLMQYMGICACLSALPIPFIDDFNIVAVFFWLLLFFGGFVLPPVTGIMINSVGDY